MSPADGTHEDEDLVARFLEEWRVQSAKAKRKATEANQVIASDAGAEVKGND